MRVTWKCGHNAKRILANLDQEEANARSVIQDLLIRGAADRKSLRNKIASEKRKLQILGVITRALRKNGEA